MRIAFQNIPKTVEEFISMAEYSLFTPSQVAALFIVALCAYPEDREECYRMIDLLKGPQALNHMEKKYILERMMGKSAYLGKSYLAGSTPENNYTPDCPYTVVLEEKLDVLTEKDYVTLQILTCGADNPRKIVLRKKGEHWFLWDYTELLTDIRRPACFDPWK